MAKLLHFTDIEELPCMGRTRSRPLGSSSAVSKYMALYDPIRYCGNDMSFGDALLVVVYTLMALLKQRFDHVARVDSCPFCSFLLN